MASPLAGECPPGAREARLAKAEAPDSVVFFALYQSALIEYPAPGEQEAGVSAVVWKGWVSPWFVPRASLARNRRGVESVKAWEIFSAWASVKLVFGPAVAGLNAGRSMG